MAPEIGAEGGQDIFVGFEANTFDHQHAVTEQTLNPLLLKLLEEVRAVAGQAVHAYFAAPPLSSTVFIKERVKGTQAKLLISPNSSSIENTVLTYGIQ